LTDFLCSFEEITDLVSSFLSSEVGMKLGCCSSTKDAHPEEL